MSLLAVQRHPVRTCTLHRVSGPGIGPGALALGLSFARSFVLIKAFGFASLLACLLACLLAFAQPAAAAVVIEGVDLTVAPNNTVTVTSSGSPQYFGSVGSAGNYGFINGWGVSSGQITWTDNNASVAATLNGTGMHVPVSGRIANSNGSISGSVVMTVSPAFGAVLRGLIPAGQPTHYESSIASGSVEFQVGGTATVLNAEATLIDSMELSVDRFANTVTIDFGGNALAFGAVGNAGLFSFVNGWRVVAGDLTWRDTMARSVATLYAPGLNVPTSGLSANSGNILGSLELGGTSTLAALLENQYGIGTSAFRSLAARSPTTDFYLEGVVIVPEPSPTALGAAAGATILGLRGLAGVVARKKRERKREKKRNEHRE